MCPPALRVCRRACPRRPDANARADKCNRVCKGKSRNAKRSDRRIDRAVFTEDVVRSAMRRPMLAHVSYAMLGDAAGDVTALHHIHQLQRWVLFVPVFAALFVPVVSVGARQRCLCPLCLLVHASAQRN